MEEEERRADGRGREKSRWKKKRKEWVEEQKKKSLLKRKREKQLEADEDKRRLEGREKSRGMREEYICGRDREKSRWKRKREE